MPVSTNDFADKLRQVADFYDEFGLSPKIAALLHDASNIARSFSGIVDKNDKLKAENAKLRSLSAEVAGILFNLDVDRCGLCDRDNINHPCPVNTTKGGECLIKSELRKMGVEVDE